MTTTILWGVRLSPFTLKLEACLRYHDLSYKRLPAEGNYLENARTLLSLELAKKNGKVSRYPTLDADLDEYPAVPFLSEDGKHFQYDSSAIAHYLDSKLSTQSMSPLFPNNNTFNFIAHLIDEAFDEFALYMVHHMRWIGSAKTTPMGKLLGQEFKRALPPGGAFALSRSFPKRQVRRTPYLFSVAPSGYKAGVSRALTPPSRQGFPETQTLLNQCWKQYLNAMEHVLDKQDYLLGDIFSVADASAYGQLAMNLVDPEAAEKMRSIAPTTYNWLRRIEQSKHLESRHSSGSLYLSPHLKPLLNTIMGTFSALMIQNEKAYNMAREQGETLFNEKAFDQHRALFDGQLRGYPFRTVVKTFQVRVWREIKAHWGELSQAEQAEVRTVVDLTELFD